MKDSVEEGDSLFLLHRHSNRFLLISIVTAHLYSKICLLTLAVLGLSRIFLSS